MKIAEGVGLHVGSLCWAGARVTKVGVVRVTLLRGCPLVSWFWVEVVLCPPELFYGVGVRRTHAAK